MRFEDYDLLSKPFRPPFAQQDLTAGNIELARAGYDRVAKSLDALVTQYIPAGNDYRSMLIGLNESVGAHMSGSIQPGRVEQPLLPLLDEEYLLRWIPELMHWVDSIEVRRRAERVTFAVSSFVYETSVLWGIYEGLRNSYSKSFMVDLSVALERYGFWRAVAARDKEGLDVLGTRQTLKEFISDEQSRINHSLTKIGMSAADIQNQMRATQEEADNLIVAAKASLAEVTSTVEKIKIDVAESNERLETVTKGIVSAEAQVVAFASAVREELKVDTTKKLWKQRARWSCVSFWISAAVIAAAILAPPAWAIYHIETVLAFLKRVGDAATQGLPPDATNTQLTAATISRLVVITAPLGLYFWAVKLLVRFNTRSMMLMDDARQRHTTLDTYFHLIERSGATTEERGLMLNALFRPLPGQGQDSVEPPNFMELVKRE
ncbi:hypothetical protein ASD74_02520 [Rhizobium sp. Root564]|nr:hypothetical protein ASD74_02520 [Rhizobium sp. Root564]